MHRHSSTGIQPRASNAAATAGGRKATVAGKTALTAGMSATAVVQRKNAWYGSGPQSTPKENPLFTIAGAISSATGIDKATILRNWAKGTNLSVAATARAAVTKSEMETHYRPDTASAWLDTPNKAPGTRKDPDWISAVGNLGKIEDQIKGENVRPYNGGHLIAWEFLNEEANRKGNIAPQAADQNQALFRRIERSVEANASHGGNGVEVIVNTPYNNDGYAVTFKQLIDNGVIADNKQIDEIKKKDLLKQTVTLAQMAPDTYDVYFLTRTGSLNLAKKDSREERKKYQTSKLLSYGADEVNTFLGTSHPPLSIIASNFDEVTQEQEPTAFAHIVFLNYRYHPGTVAAAQEDSKLKNVAAPEVLKADPQKAALAEKEPEDFWGKVTRLLIQNYGVSATLVLFLVIAVFLGWYIKSQKST